MHAASVYPEPGSNSLKNYFTDTWYQLFTSLELNLFALLTFFLGYQYLLSDIVYSLLGIVRVKFFVLMSLFQNIISSFVVQFSRSNSLPALADIFVIISLTFYFVKYFFEFF